MSKQELMNFPRMTKKGLIGLCKKDKLYVTPRLNDVLYLHYKGYSDIECLEEYTGLKCLWFECNAISEIKGLENQKNLRCLFLHHNLIKKIENLHFCPELDTLNLSHNFINHVENLGIDVLPVLSSLDLSYNYLKTFEGVQGLAECKNVSVLDLSHNRIEDILVVKIFAKMPELRVLIMEGNPVVSKIPQYRKTLILECKQLQYLDQRPVSPRDRACAEAWKRGGYTEERKELAWWQKQQRKKMRQNVNSTILLRQKALGEPADLIPTSSDEDEKAERAAELEESNRNAAAEALEAKTIWESLHEEQCTICKRIGCKITHKQKHTRLKDQHEEVEEIMKDIFFSFHEDSLSEDRKVCVYFKNNKPEENYEEPEKIMENIFINFHYEQDNEEPEEFMKDVFIKLHDSDLLLTSHAATQSNENVVNEFHEEELQLENKQFEDFMENIFIEFHYEQSKQEKEGFKGQKQDNKSEEFMEDIFIKFNDSELSQSNKKIICDVFQEKQTQPQNEHPRDFMENYLRFHENIKENNFPDYFRNKYDKSLKKAYENYFKYVNEVISPECEQSTSQSTFFEKNKPRTIIKPSSEKNVNFKSPTSMRYKRKCLNMESDDAKANNLKIDEKKLKIDEKNELNSSNFLNVWTLHSFEKLSKLKGRESSCLIVDEILEEILNRI